MTDSKAPTPIEELLKQSINQAGAITEDQRNRLIIPLVETYRAVLNEINSGGVADLSVVLSVLSSLHIACKVNVARLKEPNNTMLQMDIFEALAEAFHWQSYQAAKIVIKHKKTIDLGEGLGAAPEVACG